MHAPIILSALCLLFSRVTAQSSATATDASPSTTAGPSSGVQVDVGSGAKFIFNPPNITASKGTVVTFVFKGSIPHSVTQSLFEKPCTYLAASGGSSAGFDSGSQTGEKQFTVTITDDTKPIWFYCKISNHCGQGMVGSINAPTSGNTFDAFLAAAKAIGSSQEPVTDNGPITGGVNGIATATPSAASTSSGSANPSSTNRPNGANTAFAGNTPFGLFMGVLAALLAFA